VKKNLPWEEHSCRICLGNAKDRKSFVGRVCQRKKGPAEFKKGRKKKSLTLFQSCEMKVWCSRKGTGRKLRGFREPDLAEHDISPSFSMKRYSKENVSGVGGLRPREGKGPGHYFNGRADRGDVGGSEQGRRVKTAGHGPEGMPSATVGGVVSPARGAKGKAEVEESGIRSTRRDSGGRKETVVQSNGPINRKRMEKTAGRKRKLDVAFAGGRKRSPSARKSEKNIP